MADNRHIVRGGRDALDVIAARHTSTIIEAEELGQATVEICSRCEQLWPCDSNQLVGVIKAIGHGEWIADRRP